MAQLALINQVKTTKKVFAKKHNFSILGKKDYNLTPGTYVGTPIKEQDTEPFEDKMERLLIELADVRKEAVTLDSEINKTA